MKNRFALITLTASMAGLLVFAVSGCNKPPDTTGAPAPSLTVGTEIDDSVVTSRVKSALLADPSIKSFDFKVETRKGEVMLSGFVDNQTQLDLATSTARAVAGVKAIQNNVAIKGSPTTVGNQVDDGITTGRVKAALLADPSIKSLDIAVVTRKEEVQLSGFVNNQGQMDRAIEVARGIEGVRKVTNEMAIKK